MPRKPTTTFGPVAFGKDGKVRPAFERLPDQKDQQENEVLHRFLKYVQGDVTPEGATIVALDEADHDGEIRLADGSKHAIIQLTELRLDDVSEPMTKADYLAGNWRGAAIPPFVMTATKAGLVFTPDPDGIYRTLQREKVEAALAEKVRAKIARHYAKPTDAEFWLIVFTTASDVGGMSSGWEGGVWRESEMAKGARLFLEKSGSGPFDRIFYFHLPLRPEQIWPVRRRTTLPQR